MNKKKILTLCLVACLAITAIAGASLAYFTDTDSANNTFTVGNVKIELMESQLHRSNAGRGYTDVEPEYKVDNNNANGVPDLWTANITPEGNSENTPDAKNSPYAQKEGATYFSDEQIEADAKTYQTDYLPAHNSVFPGSFAHKNPYIKNTGKNAAYVRIKMNIPAGAAAFTYPVLTSSAIDDSMMTKQYIPHDDGSETHVFTFLKPLQPGAITFWSPISTVYFPHSLGNDVFGDVEGFDVEVIAEAIQADGFDSADEAFAAFDKA